MLLNNAAKEPSYPLFGHEHVETFFQEQPSNPAMSTQSNFPFSWLDEDNDFACTTPERRLYLVVFLSAFNDLIAGTGHIKEMAVLWFKGEIDNAPITYQDVLSIFNFKASRTAAIEACVNGNPNLLLSKVRHRTRVETTYRPRRKKSLAS